MTLYDLCARVFNREVATQVIDGYLGLTNEDIIELVKAAQEDMRERAALECLDINDTAPWCAPSPSEYANAIRALPIEV